MGTSATIEAKERELPQFVVVNVTDQTPHPDGIVEVTPRSGRVSFVNHDPIEYRIRFYQPKTDPNAGGIDLLLPALGSLTQLIRKDQAFSYSIMQVHVEDAMTGKGGGTTN
jgi:hypothetical protein